tara:strand:+ start:1377 stop:1550 length:174 start_codon:yes stop_codon:yes gene_type:complete
MIGMLYVRYIQMTNAPNKSPYSRIKEWKLFRKRIVPSKKGKKPYDRQKEKEIKKYDT